MTNPTTYRRLGELLVEEGVLTSLQLSIALADQRVTNRRLGTIVVDRGFCQERDVAGCLATQYGYPLVDLEGYKACPEALHTLSCDHAVQFQALPLGLRDGVLMVAIADPIDVLATDRLTALIHHRISWVIAPQSSLQESIRRFYGMDDSVFAPSESVSSMPARFTPIAPAIHQGPVLVVDARDEELGRKVTLLGLASSDPWSVEHRLMVQASSRILHPLMAVIHDVIPSDEFYWTVFPKLGGETLERVLSLRGPRSLAQAAELVSKVAEVQDALLQSQASAAWICPANLLITGKGPLAVPFQLPPHSYEKGENESEHQRAVFCLGRLLQDCLREPDGRIPSLPAMMADLIDRCLEPGGFHSPIEVAGALRAYNWVALSNPAFPALADEKEELLQTITYQPTKNVPFWKRWWKGAA